MDFEKLAHRIAGRGFFGDPEYDCQHPEYSYSAIYELFVKECEAELEAAFASAEQS